MLTFKVMLGVEAGPGPGRRAEALGFALQALGTDG